MRKKQTNPLYLVFAFLTIVMLTLSLIAPSLCSGSEQEWRWYENEEWGFKFKFPAKWEIDRIVNGEHFFLEIPGIKDRFIRVYADPSNNTLEECAENLSESFSSKTIENTTATPEIRAIENTTLGGKKAVRIIVKIKISTLGWGTEYFREDIIVVKNEDTVYKLYFESLWEDKWGDIKAEIRSSWKFI
jgi:hypothetical protein